MRTVERLKRQLVTLKIKPELVDGVYIFHLKGIGTIRSGAHDWKAACGKVAANLDQLAGLRG